MITVVESSRHGKAVAGTKKTSTFQVRDNYAGGYLLLKQFAFKVDDETSRERAKAKAEIFAQTVSQ